MFVTRLSQPYHKLVTPFTKPPQPCNKFTSSLQPCDHNVMFVTTLSQPCHNLVIFSLPYRNLVTTFLQACDKATHVHLMIFILTKTQRKSIEVHSTLSKCQYYM